MLSRSLLPLAVLATLAAAASAQTTCYSNRASWSASVGAPTASEDFSGFTADTPFQLAPVTLAVGSLGVFQGPSSFRNLVEVAPFAYTDNNGTAHASMFTDFGFVTVRLVLSAPCSAVGFDVYGIDNEGLEVAWLSNGVQLGSCTVSAATAEFIGVSSSVPIDTLEFRSLSGQPGGEGFGLDDIAIVAGGGAGAFCTPGQAGVMACPCSNPPAGTNRGCDNSAATGGASISASGLASLANDTLQFQTAGERANATSIVLSGTLSLGTGVTFGQGVRCSGGVLKRLYVKTAVAGSLVAPAAGDASVSARHTALNDPLAPGAQRIYSVYYRDPVVLGGCLSQLTYNTTNALLVAWAP